MTGGKADGKVAGRVVCAAAACLLVVFVGLTACAPAAAPKAAPILLFTGAGTSANDVAAVEAVLDDRHLAYATANSRQLNRLSESQLMAYRLLIIPGGDFIAMSESLTPGATRSIHDAVQQGGMNYLGICAGAFLAAHGTYNSVNLTSGVRFGFYAAERQGVRKAAVAITGIDVRPMDHYWEDGPELTGWGEVVGTYPDGTPAIVEGESGKGWVVLSGVHLEAPESWRRGMGFLTPARVDNAYAGRVVEAALNRKTLPKYP